MQCHILVLYLCLLDQHICLQQVITVIYSTAWVGQRVANFLFFKSTPALAVIMTVAVSENPESKLTSP